MVALRRLFRVFLRDMAPVKNGGITLQMRSFCQKYTANGGKGALAVQEAGYAGGDSNAFARRAWELLQNPKVTKELHRIRAMEIEGKLASVAMGTLAGIMADDDAPAPARVRAATWVLEVSGHGSKGTVEALGAGEKELGER